MATWCPGRRPAVEVPEVEFEAGNAITRHLQASCVCRTAVDLWTVDQAACHWHVTPSRARGILSTRAISPVSGYPADEVGAVQGH